MKKMAALCAIVMMVVPAFAEYTKLGIPDSTDIRTEVVDSWLTAPLADLRVRQREVRQNGAGHHFQLSLEEGSDEFAIAIVPQRGSAGGLASAAQYPAGSPGTWMLYRNRKTGKPTRCVMYFNSDSDVFVEFRNGTTKTYASMVICGSYTARSVPVGVAFKRLYTYSFDDIMEITQKTLPWDRVNVVPGQYHSIQQMIAVIREQLPYITYAEYACYNEDGELYSLRTGAPLSLAQSDTNVFVPSASQQATGDVDRQLTLGAAGFVKWIADGIVRPATGHRTRIREMTTPTVNYNSLGKSGVTAQQWSLSFSLDCCRNLAVAVLNAFSSKQSYTYKMGDTDITGVDVRMNPFVADTVDGKIVRSTGYYKDTGYAVSELTGLLYVLAVTEPRYLYFGAIKQYSTEKRNESVFDSCAAFFPYFDDDGYFVCTVFEKGKEYTLSEFIERHPGSFVHLERLKSTDYFDPSIP